MIFTPTFQSFATRKPLFTLIVVSYAATVQIHMAHIPSDSSGFSVFPTSFPWAL